MCGDETPKPTDTKRQQIPQRQRRTGGVMKNFLTAILFYALAVWFFIWGIYFALTTNNILAILTCWVISAIAYSKPTDLKQQRHGAGE